MNISDDVTHKYLKAIAEQYKFRKVIQRGLITGIFTAIGATIGFAIVLVVASKLLSGLKEVPFVDNILQQTKLDVIIESELNNLSTTENPDEQSTQQSEEEKITYTTFTNEQIGFEFKYPSIFTTITDNFAELNSSKLIEFAGESYIQKLELYKDLELTIEGEKRKAEVVNEFLEEDTLDLYEGGAIVDGNQIKNPLFVYNFKFNESNYTFIAIADTETPKISRELFIALLESIE